jgi:heterodisulfide reductase subunit A-like polyferredoxin
MLYCIALFITIAASVRLEEIHEVIIIGAGIAGIGASKTLT